MVNSAHSIKYDGELQQCRCTPVLFAHANRVSQSIELAKCFIFCIVVVVVAVDYIQTVWEMRFSLIKYC